MIINYNRIKKINFDGVNFGYLRILVEVFSYLSKHFLDVAKCIALCLMIVSMRIPKFIIKISFDNVG